MGFLFKNVNDKSFLSKDLLQRAQKECKHLAIKYKVNDISIHLNSPVKIFVEMQILSDDQNIDLAKQCLLLIKTQRLYLFQTKFFIEN